MVVMIKSLLFLLVLSQIQTKMLMETLQKGELNDISGRDAYNVKGHFLFNHLVDLLSISS
ncbi:hypothetical protein V144x_50360 [Gimesia aquarii]|uniref:Uncharacterized protein n=2 Tax=Gimesia aquarii TaxID=2527964 RepID=A0A517W2P9_9PLAN|nr:hypothetical protein V144x_50360 [Gimesia aquarii]